MHAQVLSSLLDCKAHLVMCSLHKYFWTSIKYKHYVEVQKWTQPDSSLHDVIKETTKKNKWLMFSLQTACQGYVQNVLGNTEEVCQLSLGGEGGEQETSVSRF